MSVIIPVWKKKAGDGCHEEIIETVINTWVSMAARPSHTYMRHLDIVDNNVLMWYQLETKDKIVSLC